MKRLATIPFALVPVFVFLLPCLDGGELLTNLFLKGFSVVPTPRQVELLGAIRRPGREHSTRGVDEASGDCSQGIRNPEWGRRGLTGSGG